jgi:hypothetical protein
MMGGLNALDVEMVIVVSQGISPDELTEVTTA